MKIPRVGPDVEFWFQDEDWGPDFARRIYTAHFAQDREISDAKAIAAILFALGRPASVIE